ncbi:lysylphosphatidylglycerol synthase transmembrane domain-containing protein [Kosmotoga pacifica]|uniref:Lysylphosphatidylglycerol synthetase n=1 Tax=Kosmotoga pacifica TaxID=1330330 RepID=A0A0G2ZFJ5_9BACT|nr:lysylphosphatidylglycerol synthase transmembrane domain-containing protein [Kosmotoga pacifica]AKI97538.1 hypothetical protein IX53_06600 [Kosmotoga pacifica]
MEENRKQTFSYKKAFYALIISLIVIFAILAFLGENVDLSLVLKLSPSWIIGTISIYMLAQSINALRTKLLLKSYGINLPYKEAFANILLMQFFNNLTPFAAGGQPYQVYDLSKRGVETTTAAAVVVSRYVVNNVAILILALIFLPKYWNAFLKIPGIGIFASLGALMTIALLIFLVTLSYSKKMLIRSLDIFLKPTFIRKLLGKSLDCEPDEVREYLIKKFEEFNYYMKLIWKKGPHNMFIDIALSILFSVVFKFIMYFVLMGLLGVSQVTSSVSFLEVWGVQELLFLVAFYVPTPGASGALELGLFYMLGGVLPKGVIGIAVALWRLLTYHFMIVLGTVIFLARQKRIANKKNRGN